MRNCDTNRFPAAYRLERLTSGGLPIALSVWWRHRDAGSVLFYPSTMASPLLHRFYLEELWRMGLNIFGLHPLSHGESPHVKKSFVFDDIIRNGIDALTWIQERVCGPIVISGHSQGGILALAHVCQDTRPAAAFPFCTLLPQHPQAGTVTRFRNMLRHKNRLLATVRTVAKFLPRLPIAIPFYLEIDRITSGARNPFAPARHMRLSYPLSFVSSLFNADLSAACKEGVIRCPVILMSARDDALFSAHLMEDMLAPIKTPLKKIVWISGGGHMAPMCPQYATEAATRLTEHCAGLGFALYRCGQTTV